MSTLLIDRLCDMVAAGEMSRAGLARAAGLHPNSLRKLGDEDWNPTADTLGKLEKFLASGSRGVMATPEQIIDEARNGRMFILVDDEDRENEGDLVIPAQMATPDAINFMAKHGRGLICLALARERVDQLGLQPMSRTNGMRLGTAFTASIEARDGVTTGISAADRARTISVAIDASQGPEHIVSPGHVFPLIAREGGVLVRAGHTEAAVDVARLAGLNPSGVICEIMSDDGSMARMDDLFAFAQLHSLRIGTIRDLIAYRLRKDRIVEQTAEAQFESRWGGTWTARTFLNKASGMEQIALVKGRVDPGKPTLVRMHGLSILSDAFAEEGRRGGLLEGAMKAIAAEGTGVIVVINRPMPDALSQALKVRAGAASPADSEQLRDYGVGAQILAELGVHDMVLLTNSHHTPVALGGYGLAIVGERPILAAAGA
ncbi:MAG TPA: 3,4-dihydroxy-2-butanone-4-phosphate synthase [Allosphingosinicella sp.]|jgi:3,4-dihydroxy 2-butanone 4-phosphate synthase/GTP cyclohydrolase II|nr:3,4-dihydroxy-2-butanone-4-phosphate synthase [Allosphingosinicella sp.]